MVAWLRTVLEISVFQNLITLSWLKSFIQRTIGWEGMKKIWISTLDMRYLTSDLLYDQHLLAACQIILASLLMEKKGTAKGISNFQFTLFNFCVTRAPLFHFVRSWVALSFKVCESVSQSGMLDILPDLHFVQYIKDKCPLLTQYHQLPTATAS